MQCSGKESFLREGTEGSLDNGSELEGDVISELRSSLRMYFGPTSMYSFLNTREKSQ